MKTNRQSSIEKRAATRYPVVMFVEFDEGTGWTCDVSTSGVCIEMERPLLRGTDIRFTLIKQHTDSDTRLQCRGVVVRSERYEDRWRIAVALEVISFTG